MFGRGFESPRLHKYKSIEKINAFVIVGELHSFQPLKIFLLLYKWWMMENGKNFKMSLEELSLKGLMIIAQQPEISSAKALEQIQLLKANSKVGQSSKKSRPAS